MTSRIAAAVALGFVAVTAASAGELQAYAGAVAGFVSGPGNCGTSGPTVPAPWYAGVSVPVDGIAGCGLSGGIVDKSGGSGTLTASQGVSGQSVSGVFSGSAQARAGYWNLGVAADGSNSGGAQPGSYRQTAAFARFLLPVTLSAPGIATGTAGTIDFTFHIQGSMLSTPVAPYTQQAQTLLGIRVDGAPYGVWTSFFAGVTNDELPFLTQGGNSGLPGDFVLAPGSLRGSADVTSEARFAFLWGVPFTVEVALQTSITSCCYGSAIRSDFLDSASLSGIRAYASTAPGGPLTDFTGIDEAGNLLGPSGIIGSVPEPGSAALLLAGAAMVVTLARRRRTAARLPQPCQGAR